MLHVDALCALRALNFRCYYTLLVTSYCLHCCCCRERQKEKDEGKGNKKGEMRNGWNKKIDEPRSLFFLSYLIGSRVSLAKEILN